MNKKRHKTLEFFYTDKKKFLYTKLKKKAFIFGKTKKVLFNILIWVLG